MSSTPASSPREPGRGRERVADAARRAGRAPERRGAGRRRQVRRRGRPAGAGTRPASGASGENRTDQPWPSRRRTASSSPGTSSATCRAARRATWSAGCGWCTRSTRSRPPSSSIAARPRRWRAWSRSTSPASRPRTGSRRTTLDAFLEAARAARAGALRGADDDAGAGAEPRGLARRPSPRCASWPPEPPPAGRGRTRSTRLSMGTVQDFAVAVEEGATLVRLGSVLLRPSRPGRLAEHGCPRPLAPHPRLLRSRRGRVAVRRRRRRRQRRERGPRAQLPRAAERAPDRPSPRRGAGEHRRHLRQRRAEPRGGGGAAAAGRSDAGAPRPPCSGRPRRRPRPGDLPKVHVIAPRSFNDAQQIADRFKRACR